MNKLNMGCGFSQISGWINVDASSYCKPDIVYDLELFPWPWEENSIDEVLFNHSLEHLGQSTSVFINIMKELYRICKNGAGVSINVPHPRHDNFINDPTHVRIITPQLLTLFDKEVNDQFIEEGVSNTALAYYCNVNFKFMNYNLKLAEPYASLYTNQVIDDAELQELLTEKNNVAEEYRIVLKVLK
jgi:hypothetical protein